MASVIENDEAVLSTELIDKVTHSPSKCGIRSIAWYDELASNEFVEVAEDRRQSLDLLKGAQIIILPEHGKHSDGKLLIIISRIIPADSIELGS